MQVKRRPLKRARSSSSSSSLLSIAESRATHSPKKAKAKQNVKREAKTISSAAVSASGPDNDVQILEMQPGSAHLKLYPSMNNFASATTFTGPINVTQTEEFGDGGTVLPCTVYSEVRLVVRNF